MDADELEGAIRLGKREAARELAGEIWSQGLNAGLGARLLAQAMIEIALDGLAAEAGESEAQSLALRFASLDSGVGRWAGLVTH